MSNITTYPMEDSFETTLSQSWNGATGTVNVNDTPSFTFPSGETTYIVVNPGKSNQQVAEIDAYDANAKTLTVSSISVDKGPSVSYTQQSHAAGSKVIISDNYQFWADIVTAVNDKLDSDGGNATTTFDLSVTGSDFRIRKDGNDMKFRDDNNPEVTLSTLASGGGADTKVAITSSDTTTAVLDDKLTAGDGLTKTVVNPAGNETLDLDIDTSDTAVFVKTSSGAGDEDKVPVLNASGQLAAGFIDYASAPAATDSSEGIVELSTDEEALTGTATDKVITPANLSYVLVGGDFDDEYDIQWYIGNNIVYGATNYSTGGQVDRGSAPYNTGSPMCSIDFEGGFVYSSLKPNTGATALQWEDVDVIEFEVDMRLANIDATEHFGFGFATPPGSSLDDPTNTERHVMIYSLANNASVFIGSADGTTANSESAQSVTKTNFNNYKLVYDVGTSAELYINGVLADTSTTNLPSGAFNIMFGMGHSDNVDVDTFTFTPPKIRVKYV